MSDQQGKPEGWGDHEWAWFKKYGSATDSTARVEVAFPVVADAYTQDQFDHKTILIRIGGGVTLRMWTEDAIPYVDMLREVVARSVAHTHPQASTTPENVEEPS